MNYFKRVKGAHEFGKPISRNNTKESVMFNSHKVHGDKRIKYTPGNAVPKLSKFDIRRYKNQKNDIEAFRSKLRRLVHKTRVS
mmetsp:Transcript_29619/g.26213  ORF Transcript_29619/g.26213 Transcript_29619/m.26213 type:complete len:83 (+) Transcript_29619:607-855(+)